MSTNSQQYSLPYQRAAIASYAERNNFGVVKTYEDPGRSGLWLRNRPGLTALLRDVVGPEPEFAAILVYDVSRWGRFQDSDEAAHYEFLCKSNGIPVHYCAEPFTNDNSLASTVFKTIKRTLAAEYSRELSCRLAQTLRQIAERGCWAGSDPGYGLRRVMVWPDGRRKQVLQPGDQKTLRSASVKLTLGPRREVETIRSIYEMLLVKHLRPAEIVRRLNQRGLTRRGYPWSIYAVKEVLTNPKYAGAAVYGRKEWRLRSAPVRLPPERWVVRPDSFPQIVSMQTVLRAQKVYYDRTDQKTDAELLKALRLLWKKDGYLREEQIDASAYTPSSHTYRKRFGRLSEALRLIGYTPPPKRIYQLRLRNRRRFARMRRQVVCRLSKMFCGKVIAGNYEGFVRLPHANIDVAVNICPSNTTRGYPIWHFTPRSERGQANAVALLCLLNKSNSRIVRYCIVPRMPRANRCRLYQTSSVLAGGQRLHTMREFYKAALSANERVSSSEQQREPELLAGVPQIARYLSHSQKTVWRWISEGMPTYRSDRLIRAVPAEVCRWVQENGRPYVWQRDARGRFIPKQNLKRSLSLKPTVMRPTRIG